MPEEVMTRWLKSKRYANIKGLQLRPKRHPKVADLALSVQRGQAETFFLEAKDGSSFVLKKMYPGKFTGVKHLQSVSQILPEHPAFESGTKRQILTPASLRNTNTYHPKALASWLNNAILMPKILGLDWAAIIDKLRNETIGFSPTSRLLLCKNLSALIVLLENNRIAHRDLSAGNIFIHNQGIKLIDFDSIYHPSLTMPDSTVIGSEGYIAPFADDIRSTWHPLADRFALAILNIEILILDKNSPFNGEGGIFDQKDIYRRSGKTINYARNILKQKHPQALRLFNTALSSSTFGSCPDPQSWLAICGNSSIASKVSTLPETIIKLPQKKIDTQVFGLDSWMPPARDIYTKPITFDKWMPDSTNSHLPAPEIEIRTPKPIIPISLPDNPWED